MTKAEIYSSLLEVSEKSYYRWKSKDHVVLINLIEKYFSDEDIKEFLENGEISKFEFLPDITLILNKIEKRMIKKFNELNIDKDLSFYNFRMEFDLMAKKLKKEEIEITQMNFLNYIDSNVENNKICYIATISSLSDLEFRIYRNENW